MTMGSDELAPSNVKELWQRKLQDPNPNVDNLKGWKSLVKLEALVVQVKDASSAGDGGLVHPLMQRYRTKSCPI